jgi:DNA polymerase-1
MPTLYLIDGLGQFFRAYHAIRTPMTSPVTKEPTNLTFGFVGMMLKLLRAEGPNLKAAGAPDYVAVAMDVGGDRGTFRSQLYPEYKAQRPEPPSDLKPQVQRCLDLLRAIGVPVIGCEGFEADDVMATLVVRLRQQHPDLAIRLVSKDKDLKQLLCDCPPCDAGATPSADARAPGSPLVELFDVHTDTPYSAASLLADTGLRPDQVPDMLTLMGDTVDNVPGVDGVGEKTAAQLLRDFGSLDALLARADEIKGKRGEKLREAIPRLGLSRELVTLRSDVPCDFDLDAASVSRLNLAQLLPILRELGFNRYQDEVRALMAARGDVLEGAEAALASKQPSANATAAMLFARPGPPPAITQAAPKLSRARPADNDSAPGLFDDMPNGEPLVVRTAQSGTYTAITTRDQLDTLIRACEAAVASGGVLALDTETTSLSFLDAKLCGISLAITPGEAFYIPIRSPDCAAHMCEEDVLAALRPLLESPDVPKCGHNLKYDMLVLRRAGINLQGLSAPGACDTMVASYLLDASRSSHGLDALALAFLNRTNISISELIGSGKNQKCFDSVSLDSATQYAAEDADVALQLRNIMMPQLTDLGLIPLMQAVEMPLVDVLAELEYNGIIVDAAELDRQRARLQHKIDDLLARLGSYWRATLGRNVEPDSPKQLAVALFAKPDDDPPGLGLKAAKKTKTGYSTDAEVLDALVLEGSSPAPEMVLDYRQLSKLVSTYLVALKEAIHPATGRVHTSFHQTVAATGRLASSDPNLQNIPIRTDVGREIRRAFVAPPGHVLITADYSQIELRLLAHLSRDPALIEAFQQGADIHQAVAAQIHGVDPSLVTREQRAGAKMVNFGIVYGITSYGLARRLKIGERDAATIIDAYKRRFAGITTFLQECVEQARAKGYVETILKRRRPIPDVDSRIPSRRALAERLAINSVVQGSAADLIKLAMVHLHQDLRAANAATPTATPSSDLSFLLGTKMLLQIHDELVFETPEAHAERAMEHVKTRMQNAMELAVPLVADAAMARNWFEGK